MKNSAIALCISLLLAGQVFGIAWKDDFERQEIGEDWLSKARGGGGANWKIEKGILKGIWPSWSFQMLYMEEYPFLDYTIQVKCRIDKVWQSPELAGAGIVFRTSDPEEIYPSYYCYGICTLSTMFLIDRGKAAGNWQVMPRKWVKYDVDEWYILKLVAIGDSFFGYVNDEPMCNLKDKSFKGKFVGLVIGSNVDASFDDFMITDQVDEDALKDFAVSSGDKAATTWAGLKAQ